MKRRGAVAVDAFDVAGAEMREAELAAWEWDDDLSSVEMPGDDQVKGVGNPSHDAGEVTQKDAQARGRVRKLVRSRFPRCVCLWVDTHDLDPPTAKLELDALIPKERDAFERLDRSRVDPLRERIPAVGEVVVAEHDEAGAEFVEKTLEERHPGAARHEIAGNANDVRAPFDDPVKGLLDRAPAAGGDAKMEVREVRYSETVELGRKSFELDLENAAT
jgi:hypothetical protein